ncbi:PTS mannitol transporter subunit IICB [Polycladomyces sp. WAk]|uniref:PTS system mannitol-specific EIICB component n=1 Tax=Polycladomyces zharkentensis TaxID=2807616 RepID=A0ABS2WKC5_9BACL|nr:PTS transporter subunit EIIC [Polycladomyces sp. WAk]MBN2909978.1 PTS mannitol transporter subunit IICB [Polycladomyces sp. WAk]
MRKLGQLLSAIIYQNIAVIIAVGMIQAIFGIYGWWYNDRILLLVHPIYETLLPILLGYTGGRLLGGQRGAVVASIVTFGLSLASSVPNIIGAMMIGLATGWMMNRLDQTVKKHIPIGYELLVTNAVAAIVAVVLTVFCFLFVGQMLSAGVHLFNRFMEHVIHSGWLPMAALIIEPGKALFFNNVMNYGILTPLGIQQVKEIGKSIFFLLETNPGPGLGILTAYWLKARAENRKGAKLATFIHLFGGIHEVYFPYVLMNPILVPAVIVGGMAGIITFQFFDAGLVSLPSPGSIFLILGLAPREDMFYVLTGVAVSAVVSFLSAFLLLNRFSTTAPKKSSRSHVAEIIFLQNIDRLGGESRKKPVPIETHLTNEDTLFQTEPKKPLVRKIVFVCEAGMGSSAMGAAMLKKQLRKSGLNIEVDNASIDEIPPDTDLVICHQKLMKRIQQAFPGRMYYPLPSFTDMKNYEELVRFLEKGYKPTIR